MHSLKNTVVAILLLGVSYGVYQVITAPEALTTADQNMIGPLDIDDGLTVTEPTIESSDLAANLPSTALMPKSAPKLPPASTLKKASSAPNGLPDAAVKNSKSNPSAESLVNRQARHDFTGELDKNGKLTSAEVAPNAEKNLVRDQELIDALKDQLNSNDELNSFSGSPQANIMATPTNPEKSNAPATSEPKANSFEPKSSLTESAPTGPTVDSLQALWKEIESMTEAGRFRLALETLTPHFGDPDLSPIQRKRLMAWLDSLAGKVIYSAEHHLDQPYQVGSDESLVDIANRWNVTSQLVYNINKSKIENPSNLPPGTELKRVVGPFHAEIDLTKKVMTLFVRNLYAGRFAIEIDTNSSIQPGQYSVTQKQTNGTNSSGQPASHMIQLNNGVCIQATDTTVGQSCIGLKSKDAADLFTIFTEQSQFFVK